MPSIAAVKPPVADVTVVVPSATRSVTASRMPAWTTSVALGCVRPAVVISSVILVVISASVSACTRNSAEKAQVSYDCW